MGKHCADCNDKKEIEKWSVEKLMIQNKDNLI